jgi:hypothetical protein
MFLVQEDDITKHRCNKIFSTEFNRFISQFTIMESIETKIREVAT